MLISMTQCYFECCAEIQPSRQFRWWTWGSRKPGQVPGQVHRAGARQSWRLKPGHCSARVQALDLGTILQLLGPQSVGGLLRAAVVVLLNAQPHAVPNQVLGIEFWVSKKG